MFVQHENILIWFATISTEFVENVCNADDSEIICLGTFECVCIQTTEWAKLAICLRKCEGPD